MTVVARSESPQVITRMARDTQVTIIVIFAINLKKEIMQSNIFMTMIWTPMREV